jgi:hypothetical protein
MGGAPQVAMCVASQIWQIVFASQTFQVFCFYFANPSGFSFGPSQKGRICSSEQWHQNLSIILYHHLHNFARPTKALTTSRHLKKGLNINTNMLCALLGL